ncbi:Myxococcus cysteine-rich repeat-containing protein [Nannocystis exedens]|uniref:Myxococcus cysteine-rich repeat-containing protein n=2 Tax=Nannocystis exedens TaxID=54 RepID=A0A1I1VTN6_9BACT|nr:hypothetical protein NAEX_05911 [Nannocystis exedens]SFD86215.1 Myxococcus cysteine-rich repeat-containing protein [Nannocystis exedens]
MAAMKTLARCATPALAAITLLSLSACGDAVATTDTLEPSSTTTDGSTTEPGTTDAPTTGVPTTTSDTDDGTASDGDSTTTGDPSTSTTTTTSTATTDDSTTTDGSTAPASECGNGLVEDGEECDDGGDNGPSQACLAGCVLNVCGDGDQGPGEGCDDGNTADRDGCSAACVSELCGDGVVQAGLGEQCDDGNTDADDGCSAACVLESCGDGVLTMELGEQCDDGNTAAEDGCSDTCAIEACGDGVTQAGLGETCDDGNTDADDGCGPTCQVEACGDGVVQAGEDCDDGNDVSGDGCSPTCEVEVLSLCGPGQVSLLVNEGFESGALAPWTTNGGVVVTMNPHDGVWAAEASDNWHVQQTFAATPVAQLVSADFWTWHDAADNPAMYVEWGYADNTVGSTFYSNQQLDGWVLHDILPLLDGSKSLTRLQVWGYTGGQPLPDITRFDSFRLCRDL